MLRAGRGGRPGGSDCVGYLSAVDESEAIERLLVTAFVLVVDPHLDQLFHLFGPPALLIPVRDGTTP